MNKIAKSRIIELSSNNASSNINNVSWSNTIQPITLNEGDEVSVKMAFIDFGGNANADINLLEDLSIIFTIGFYIYKREGQFAGDTHKSNSMHRLQFILS